MESRIMVIFPVLLIALSVVGFSYAYWTDTLTIDGEVSTGELDVQFSAQATNDPDGENDPKECGTWTYDGQQFTWSGDRYDFDVANITCELVDEDGDPSEGGSTNDGNEKITINVENGYPSYYGSVAFTIDNIGNIPAKILSIKLVEVSKDSTTKSVDVDLVACQWVKVDVDDDGENDFELHLSNLAVGQTIDVGGWLLGDLCIHILDGAEENTSYDFTIEIVVGQFNAL